VPVTSMALGELVLPLGMLLTAAWRLKNRRQTTAGLAAGWQAKAGSTSGIRRYPGFASGTGAKNHEALKKVAGLPAGWQAKPPAPPQASGFS
jgi:hypothetical protein